MRQRNDRSAVVWLTQSPFGPAAAAGRQVLHEHNRRVVANHEPVDGLLARGYSLVERQAIQGLPFYEAYIQVAPRPEDWPTPIGKVGQLTTTEYDWTADLESITAQFDVLPGTAHSTVTYRVDLLMVTVPAFLDAPMPAP